MKEYKNKINNNNKTYNNANKTFFDFKEKNKGNTINNKININNILSNTKNITLDSHTFNNIYRKEKSKNNNTEDLVNNNINKFAYQHESPTQIRNASKTKQKKFIRHKYVESRYFSNKSSYNPKLEDYINNSFKNINDFNGISNLYLRNKKRKNNLNQKDFNKIINVNYSHNKTTESSLNKRKKYSQSVNSKNKRIKKIKNKNESCLIIKNKNFFKKSQTKPKQNINSYKDINTNYINYNSNKSRNKDANESFGLNYIVKKKLKSTLFNSQNSKNTFNKKKRNNNSSISYEKNDSGRFNNETFSKYNKYKKNKIKKNNMNQINRTYNNSYKNQKGKESVKFIKNKNLEKRVYLELKRKNLNNIKISQIYDKDKKINTKNNTHYNTKNNSIIGIRNNKTKIIINKSKSIENYENKNNRPNYIQKRKIYKSQNSKIKTNNCSKKLLLSEYTSNTQKDKRNNKKRRIINHSELNLTQDSFFKSYGDMDLNNLQRTYKSNEKNNKNKNGNITNLITQKKN